MTIAERWQQGDSSQAMATGRRLGKATRGRYLLQDEGRAVTEQGDRRAGRWQLAGQRTDRKLERRWQGDNMVADRATAGTAERRRRANPRRIFLLIALIPCERGTGERGEITKIGDRSD